MSNKCYVATQCLVLVTALVSGSCVERESALLQAQGIPANPKAIEAALAAGASPADKVLALRRESGLYGSSEIVALLLKAGADPQQGLGAAAAWGHLDIVKQLLDAGADPSNGAVLFEGIVGDDPAILAALLEKWPKNGEPADLQIALREAARLRKLKAVAFLLERGADPAAKNDRGVSVLDEERKSEHWDVVEILIKAKRK